MSEAVFGLAGVLIGGAITWIIEIWRSRRVDADEGRVAARLVADELRSIHNARTVKEPEFPRKTELALQADAWLAHRTVLARELTDEGWRAVASAYDALVNPTGGMRGEEWVDKFYTRALEALRPLMTGTWRHRWPRLQRRR